MNGNTMDTQSWEPWKFREPWRLARYIDEYANEVFPLARRPQKGRAGSI
jgi:hypothetical protein